MSEQPVGASSLATPAELAAWLGEAVPASDPRAASVLAAASSLVRSHTGRDWVDVPVPDDVRVVVVQAAARVWRNPTGVVQESTGPFTARYAEAAGHGLYLTDTEKAVLARYRVKAGGLWTLSTSRDAQRSTVYVPTGPQPAGYPFPWYEA